MKLISSLFLTRSSLRYTNGRTRVVISQHCRRNRVEMLPSANVTTQNLARMRNGKERGAEVVQCLVVAERSCWQWTNTTLSPLMDF